MWILVVEDDPDMARVLEQGLEEQNHVVTLATDGEEALAAVAVGHFDAIVLDVMLTHLDGVQVSRRVRASGNAVPILMLTARDASADVVQGLDAGADDYLVKPFVFGVLLARLRAISRRPARSANTVLQIDDLMLDPASHTVSRNSKPVCLTATEFRLLEFLMRRAGRAASRSTIIEGIWGFEEDVAPNTVDVYIKALRDKVDASGLRKLIHTVRGYGYILRE